MRKILAFTALSAPLALMACGSDVEEQEATDEMAADAEMSAAPAENDEIDAVTLADNDVSGSYTMSGGDGSNETLTLDSSDMSYIYTRGDGESFEGNYETFDDYRIRIVDFDDRDAYFSFDGDSIYRLASETSLPQDRITVSANYRRDNTNAAQTGGPDATTASVADKRQ